MTYTFKLLLCSTLVACGGGGTKTEPVAPTAKATPFVLQVGGTVKTSGGTLSLLSTSEIRENDEVVLVVKTSRRATIYVAYCDTQQQLTIFPETGTLTAEPDVELRIPSTESFVTDDHPGVDHMFVIASARDLGRTDPKLQEVLLRAQGGKTPCPELDPTPLEPEDQMVADKSPDVVPDEKPPGDPVEKPPATNPAEKPKQPDDKLRGVGGPRTTTPKVKPIEPGLKPRGIPLRARGFKAPPSTGAGGPMAGTGSDADDIAIYPITFQHK